MLTMLKRLDKIRFRGQRRDEFLDLAESPNTSDNECSDEVVMKPRASIKDTEELRDPVSAASLCSQLPQTEPQVGYFFLIKLSFLAAISSSVARLVGLFMLEHGRSYCKFTLFTLNMVELKEKLHRSLHDLKPN